MMSCFEYFFTEEVFSNVPELVYYNFCLKALLRTNVLNEVTAAPFSVSFFSTASCKKRRQKRCGYDVIKDVCT